jgi:pimeloyl-ACP methyl ester carboxylesterase
MMHPTPEQYLAPVVGTDTIVERPDGTRILSTVTGSGTKGDVVLAHGYAIDRHCWNIIASELADRGMRVVTFDQRGHGKSNIGRDGIGSAQMVGDYLAVLDRHEVRNGVMVGHSMGGFVLINALIDQAGQMAERLKGAVLMATFAGDVNRKNPQNRVQIPLIRSGLMSRLVLNDRFAKTMAKSLLGNDKREEFIAPFVKTFREQDLRGLMPILEAFVRENRYPDLGRISMKCAIVVGDKDKTTPPFHTDSLHDGIKGSTIRRLMGKGHMLNWEAPEALIEEIERFNA